MCIQSDRRWDGPQPHQGDKQYSLCKAVLRKRCKWMPSAPVCHRWAKGPVSFLFLQDTKLFSESIFLRRTAHSEKILACESVPDKGMESVYIWYMCILVYSTWGRHIFPKQRLNGRSKPVDISPKMGHPGKVAELGRFDPSERDWENVNTYSNLAAKYSKSESVSTL